MKGFASQLEFQTVNYDGGIALHGVALSHADKSVRGLLQWRIAPGGIEIDFSRSLRLYDDGGQMVFQTDHLILHPLVEATTRDWSDTEPVDSLFRFEIPDDLSPGEYELRIVVYDFKTGKPTVQLGSWQPEIALARLRLPETH